MKNSDRLEELLLTAKLRICGGTVFWFCYRNDRERIALFHRTVQALDGGEGMGGRYAQTLSRRNWRNTLTQTRSLYFPICGTIWSGIWTPVLLIRGICWSIPGGLTALLLSTAFSWICRWILLC